jgi:hypothetical protein
MQLDFQDVERCELVNETGTRVEVAAGASEPSLASTGWMRVYWRLVGCVQWAYATYFGWWAVYLLRFCYHPELYGKGFHSAAYLSLVELFFGTIGAILSLTGLIGGLGLVVLKGWARRWEIAYLSFLAVGVAGFTAGTALDIRFGADDFTVFALLSLAFGLPYAPILFVPPGRRSQGAQPPERVTHSTWDRSLDF